MTTSDLGVEAPKILTCKWCGVEFERATTRGPDPDYCRPGHRQRAYEARRAAIPADGTSEHEVWIAAAAVAAGPPERLSARSTLVSSADIANLRDRLDSCGVDWRQIKKARQA